MLIRYLSSRATKQCYFISETKLTELSDVVGNYEKVRYQDQLVIQQLKERLAQIDAPNMAVPKQSSFVSEMDGNNQISDLKDQVLKLKGLLRFTWSSKEDDLPNQIGKRYIGAYVCRSVGVYLYTARQRRPCNEFAAKFSLQRY